MNKESIHVSLYLKLDYLNTLDIKKINSLHLAKKQIKCNLYNGMLLSHHLVSSKVFVVSQTDTIPFIYFLGN